jgi:hypothetical protein
MRHKILNCLMIGCMALPNGRGGEMTGGAASYGYVVLNLHLISRGRLKKMKPLVPRDVT